MNIIFLKVKTNQEKLFTLTKIVEKHFDLSEKLLIAVPNPLVADYIDKLLWRLPEESFLPHQIEEEPCNTQIAISTSPTNINNAPILINLNPTDHPNSHEFKIIYELYDETTPAKEELSKSRYAAYSRQHPKVALQSF